MVVSSLRRRAPRDASAERRPRSASTPTSARSAEPGRHPGPGGGSAPALLQLQRLAGNRATVAALQRDLVSSTATTTAGPASTGTSSSSGTKQGWTASATASRPAAARPGVTIGGQDVDAVDMLRRLRTIPYFDAKMGEVPLTREVVAGVPEAWDVHVEAVLEQYRTRRAGKHRASTNDAAALSIALRAVAKVVAFNVLYDAALESKVATDLLELYEPEIRAATSGRGRQPPSMRLTRALVSDDPLAMYMHREITKERAASRIRRMARKAKQPPERMFGLLRERFDVEMSAYTRNSAARQYSDTGGNAYMSDSTEAAGLVSVAYFERLFGVTEPMAKPSWRGGHLKLTDASQAEMDGLLAEVTNPATKTPTKLRPGLTKNQSAHFDQVEARDADHTGRDAPSVAAAIVRLYGGKLSLAQAEQIRSRVEARIGRLPVTISVNGDRWFGTAAPSGAATVYKTHGARGQTTTFEDAYGRAASGNGPDRTISHLGKLDDTSGQDRGSLYNRFRYYKDFVAMTAGGRLRQDEAPTFAAANLNWSADSSFSEQETEKWKHGMNAYGNTHLVLDPAKVGSRALYTAECMGKPHVDPYEAFVDSVIGAKNTVGNERAWDDVSMLIINSVLENQPVATRTQYFEVQIFGQIDVATDVKEILAAPSLSPAADTNLRAFCQTHGITYRRAAAPASGIKANKWLKSDESLNALKIYLNQRTALAKAQPG